MIKLETLGMYENSHVNPVLTSQSAVKNYSFITVAGVPYLVANDLSGDNAYVDDVTFAAGEYLNGWDLTKWVNQKLVIDEGHITYGSGESYASITAGTTLLKAKSDGTLEITSEAPSSGVYFKVTDKVTLNGKAVKAMIMVA